MAPRSTETSVPVLQRSITAQSPMQITLSDVTRSQFTTKAAFSTSMLQVSPLRHRPPLQSREGRERSPSPISLHYPRPQVLSQIPRSTGWLPGGTTRPFSRLELFRVLHLARRLAQTSQLIFWIPLAIS